MRSGSRLFSLDRIISSMSPCSFSMTTNTRSGVSNMHSKLTIPGCCKFYGKKWKAGYNQSLHRTVCFSTVLSGCDGPTCKMATSFLSWLSCLVGNLILSITFIATSLPVFLCFPFNRKRFIYLGCWLNFEAHTIIFKKNWKIIIHKKSTSIYNTKLA